MNRPSTAREALIAEAIGDLAKLLDRVEAVQKGVSESRRSLSQASTELAGQLATFKSELIAQTDNAKVHMAKHMAVQIDETAKRSLATQSQAMADAAQALFKTEVGPTLQRMAQPLQQLAERLDHPWVDWLTHAATAACASAITLLLALHFLVR